MKAILLKDYGDATQMYLGESDKPFLKDHEVLVQVKAFAINRADVLQRKGKYPSPPGTSPLMGLEVAGIVVDAGHSKRWQVGDRVFGLLPSGGYAEYAAADAQMLIPMPDHFEFEQAAAIPEVFLTAYLGLVKLAQIQRGERVLIHAAAGGVGTAAIQIAHHYACRVIATASVDKHQVCKELGADLCIDYQSHSWAEQLIESEGKNAVNVVLDFLGASYFNDNLNVLAMDGRMTMLALIGGGDVPEVDLRKIIGKRLRIEGSTLRNRSQAYQRELCRDFANFIFPHIEKGDIRPVIDTIMPWEEIIQAHQRMEANEHTGKIVMRINA